MIRTENLSKKFGSREVLRDINLIFEEGQVYGIAGENGAGKTTLFRCIAGLESFEGKVLSEFEKLKDHLGLLLTDPYFFSKITGREYIRLLCNAREKKPGNIDQRNIFDLPLDQYASTYSTGMKKKLALTAILLQENKYFILDEPYNGVDIHGNILITDIIHKLKELGKTVIISSHIFSTLSDTCDIIHFLKDGIINQSVGREQFQALESEMKKMMIGEKIELMDIR